MTAKSAALARHLVMFDAPIRDVLYAVTNLVRHVWRTAHGPANTKGTVVCRALPRVAVFRVINDAPNVYPARTNVLEYVAKNALKAIARFVRTERTLV